MIANIVLILIICKSCFEIVLELVNRKEVQKNSNKIPEAFQATMDDETYQKSIRYTFSKINFSVFSNIFDLIIILIVLFSGVLPWYYELSTSWIGSNIWNDIFFLISITLILSIPSMPLEIYHQFVLEAKFGFNKMTAKLFIVDKIKNFVVGLALGVPIILALLSFVNAFSEYWWLIAFVTLTLFQIVMMVVYPAFILPWFNKFEPLEEGELKTRLMKLIDITGFKAKRLTVMDGSKRSKHSNAYFSGYGKFRQVVLYDTLVEQLEPDELEGVLAHEIGHYKKGHVIKIMITSITMMLLGLFCLAQLLKLPEFGQAFGFNETPIGPGFLLFSVLAGTVTFWITPAFNLFSRKNEFEADEFAVKAVGKSETLINALRKLSEKNLSNLTPHPFYSFFHYSHPTLLEREKAMLEAESSLQGA